MNLDAQKLSAPAGSLIQNTANVTFTGTDGQETGGSNTVVVQQQALEAFELTPGQSVTVSAGSSATFVHEVRNTGNLPTQLTVDARNLGGDEIELASLQIFVDLNGNRVVDSGDSLVMAGTPVTVQVGQTAVLLVIGTVPATSLPGNQARVELDVRNADQALSAKNINTTVVAGVAVHIQQSSTGSAPAKPNDVVVLATAVSNTGGSPAQGVAVAVDGVSQTIVMVRNAIPANTTFARFVDFVSFTPLYHLAGDAQDSYVTVAPSDLSRVDAVAFSTTTLAAGANAMLRFAVTLHSNASGSIKSSARVAFNDGQPQQRESNIVILPVAGGTAAVGYYNKTFTTPVTVGSVGYPLYVQATTAGCNLDPLKVETQNIRIISTVSNDDETFAAIETGPNTGFFRIDPAIATHDARTTAVAIGNSTLEVGRDDRLNATAECDGTAVAAQLLIDPMGVVFDSATGEPIAGAQVTLIDVNGTGNGGKAGQPAAVLLADAVTPAPSTVVTGADGQFQFPLVAPGTYQLSVRPPNGYTVPSNAPASSLPPSRRIEPEGSYLRPFLVSALTGTVLLDVPADPATISGLFVEKTASRQVVQIGDFVDYTVKVRNSSGVTLPAVTLRDMLPAGLRYYAKTARLNGAAITPQSNGRELTFTIGDMNADATVTVTYRVEVGPGASLGKLTNLAQAASGRAQSNLARAAVELQPGIFNDRGYIMGQVVAACNDGAAMKNLGVPGVRVYLEDGTYAITDAQGRYSFYGVRAQTHVLKVDGYTLPRGSMLVPTTARNANDGNSAFVDMKFGELRRADFVVSCPKSVRDKVEQRIQQSAKSQSETDVALKAAFTAEQRHQVSGSEARALPASGLIGGAASSAPQSASTGEPGAAANPKSQPGAATASPKPASVAPAELLSKVDGRIGFANLVEGQVLAVAQTDIWVKGPSGSQFTLRVNGAEISEKRVGARTSQADKRIDAWQFIGVDLKTGRNELKVSAKDPFGNERSATLHVDVPDQIARIQLTVPDNNVEADGASVALVEAKFFDKDGLQVKSRLQVTLETTAGSWQVEDSDAREEGVQTFVEGGTARFELAAPLEPGDARIRVLTSGVSAQDRVSFVPDLRPLTAAGIAEYQLSFSRAPKSALEPASAADGFEESMRLFSISGGRVQGGSRAALFLKGKIRGSNLLTMAYDSNRASGERLFRDIQPDQFYPVYGDASTRGFDAQSTSRLYLRVDNGKSYLLYGDFQTSEQNSALTLGNYSRSLTGVKHRYDNGRLGVSSFVSNDTFRQVVQEFPANGTSGPYTFQYPNGIENSEKVEILIRDRNQPSVVLKVEPQSRFMDYEFEPFTGRLLFKAPVPTLDDDMNLVYIRVTYEVDQGGDRFWVGGLSTQYKLNQYVDLGGVIVSDGNPQDWNQLYAFNSTIHIAKTAHLTAELADTYRGASGNGVGYRIEFHQDTKRMKTRFYLARTEKNFVNPGAMLSQGRGEAGGNLDVKLAAKTNFHAEFIRTEDVLNGGTQVGGEVAVQQAFNPHLKLRVSLRHAQAGALPALSSSASPAGAADVAPNDLTTIGAKLTREFPRLRRTQITAEFEQDVQDAGKHRFALGGSVPVGSRGKVYARHEFISSLGSVYAMNSIQSRNATVIGIDTDYLKHAHAFSEYRQRDDLLNRGAEAAIGLRNLWQVTPGVAVNGSFESIRTFSGIERNSIAITGGADVNTGGLRVTGRMEWRGSTNSDAYLASVALGKQVSQQWTLLTRNVMLREVGKLQSSGTRTQARMQVGAAYRGSIESRWDALSMFEYRIEDSSAVGVDPTRRSLAIFSANLNYQPGRGMTFSTRYATKWNLDRSNGLESDSLNQMVSWHITKDLSRKFDIGVIGSVLANSTFDWRKQAFGAELGYQLKQNIWISGGYNLLGFYEGDLPGGRDSRQGAFLRLRFKFDEETLKGGVRRQLQAEKQNQ